MVRAIAKQAEAERDRRAKVIHAEAEFQASQTLVNAAKILGSIPAAMQLRYLQTLTEIGAEQEFDRCLPHADRHYEALSRDDRKSGSLDGAPQRIGQTAAGDANSCGTLRAVSMPTIGKSSRRRDSGFRHSANGGGLGRRGRPKEVPRHETTG
jgi:hypothetical protein